MEKLRLNEEQSPVIDKEKLLIESQNREISRLFSGMESDRVSLSDTENILLNIGNNNPNARPYILNYVQNNSQNITSLLKENLNYAVNGAKGEVIGLYEGTKVVITGSIDLLNFMIEYSLNEKYRDEFNNQAEIIYDFVKTEGLSGIGNKVYEAIGNEMDRISKLPPEKQAKAIGEIAGNVISMLAVMKVGKVVVGKLSKIGQAESIITKAEQVGNIARVEKVKELKPENLEEKEILQKYIEELEVKKNEFYNKNTTRDAFKLDGESRIKFSEELLGRKITINQEKAILEAHELGLPNNEGKYSIGDLRKKHIILEKAGFNDNEIRTLMEKGVCGKDKLPNLGKYLPDEKGFEFLNKPEYKELLELYGGNIDAEKLLGEGQNAIILQHPNKGNRIIKVAKERAKDNIIQEFDNHQRFYETLEQGRVDFPGQLSDDVKIPFVEIGGGKNPIYFEMEKIDGQSFKSLFYRESYSKYLEQLYTKDELSKMSDSKLEKTVEELGLDPIPSIILTGDGGFSKALYNESQAFMWNKIRDPLRKQETELGDTLSFLDWKGLKHTDMHCGNFMVSRDGKTTYIIDFGNTNLNNKK